MPVQVELRLSCTRARAASRDVHIVYGLYGFYHHMNWVLGAAAHDAPPPLLRQ